MASWLLQGLPPATRECHTPLVALFSMNRLPIEKRALIINCLTEGMSIRGTTRIVGCSKNTVVKLLVDAGQAVSDYQDKALRDLTCRKLQADEIWSFVYAKRDSLTNNPEAGDVWTWVAIDEDTKLVPSWMIGDRTYQTGRVFMDDLAGRMRHRVQLTTDGLHAYLEAVEDAFGPWMVDHRILKRMYPEETTARTSYVERQNLTMRMNIRRYARRTNAFSKKLDNHAHAVALHFMAYNFCRTHKTLGRGITPAMAAGLTDHQWDATDLVNLIP